MKKHKKLFFLTVLLFTVFSVAAFAFAQVPAPTLDLKDAIDTAQQSVRGLKNVNLGDYYIYSVTYTNSSKGTFWYFNFKTIKPTTGQEINVRVYMDKSTEFSGGYFNQ